MQTRSIQIALRALVGAYAALAFLSIGCGSGARPPWTAASTAPGTDTNTCTAPEHGRISCNIVCDDGYTACGDICTRVDSDRRNCGSCGKACSGDQTCSGGVCVGSCLQGQTACNGACVDTDNDDRNCGGCGNGCSADHASAACRQGSCDISSCHPGWANCNGNVHDGCETSIDSDRNNCGGCDVSCREDEICEHGHPVRCGPSEHREGNECVANRCGDTDNDRDNCGVCGNRCSEEEICDHGHRVRCGAGYHREGNACVPNGNSCGDTDNDRDHCGGCGNRCEDDEVCDKGHRVRCTTGYHREGNRCVANGNSCGDTGNDRNNCGACGNRCGDDEVCEHGKHVKCDVGFHREGNSCVANCAGGCNGNDKVTICHRPPGNPSNEHTITVGASAVPAHLAHGDHLGPCADGTHGGG